MNNSIPQPRIDHGIRVLAVADAQTISRELARVGCAEIGVRLMTPRSIFRLLRLEQVPIPAANLLKQELHTVGGDAALQYGAIESNLNTTDILLLGTEYQLSELAVRLKQRYHDLPVIGEAIIAVLHNYTTPPPALRCGPYTLPFGRKTYIMGIINLTPDSFSGDGLAGDVSGALRQAERMLEEGADLLDVGGESTRPGAKAVRVEDELQRVVPVVRALTERFQVPISVDTYKSVVAQEALTAGATMINDISGLRFDSEMASVVSEAKVPVIVMHIHGRPHTMQQHPQYADLMSEVCNYLQQSTAIALAAGIPREQVVLDPGFGFGKTVAHNLELLRRLRELTSYGQPILLGTSRKSTIGQVLGQVPPEERLEGTAATVAIGIANGADIVRVHDVQYMARVAKMTDAITRAFID